MSLYVLPVSASELEQLQLGIEFFTNPTDATNEAALITNPPGTPTVFSYAQQLLANNISLSQVAMAVDSLMFGVTDNTIELTKLATQFLPPQVNVAVAVGLNPTVYAAEALGLALAGGNDFNHAFETDFGSLSVAQFASQVATLTGIIATLRTTTPFDPGTITSEFSYSPLTDDVVGFVNETANDGSADGAYARASDPMLAAHHT